MKVIINDVVYVPERSLPSDANVYEQALNAPMTQCDDFDDIKVIEWLHKLLDTIWVEEEGFSGKRPFGNSGWSLDLIYALIDCGYIPGKIERDEDGDFIDSEYDSREADRLVRELIRYAFYREAKS